MTIHPVHHASLRPALLSGRNWRGWTALVLAGLSPLAGCYSTRPVVTAPAPGTTVLLDLSDRGRVQLGDRIGPSAALVEGIVQNLNDSAYVLQVSAVRYQNGQTNRWSGEPLTVPVSLVTTARTRQFSRSRTLAVGFGIAAVLAAVIAKTSFFGTSGTDRQLPLPPPGES